MMSSRRIRPAVAGATAVLLAAGCGSGAAEPPDEAAATPHGYVEGAEETAEPQWRLVMADTAAGTLHMLDPATEEVTEAGTAPGVEEAVTDGRFAFFGTGGAVTVLDSGTWTVDHGDHVHYYRTEPRMVGETESGGALQAVADPAITALSSDDGVRILDRPALEDGELSATVVQGDGVALAYGQRLLVARADGAVDVLDRDGAPASPAVGERCPDPRGQAVTRRGAVIGCADGALLVTEDDGTFSAERIPYPDDPGAEPVRSFQHRPGSPVVAGPAGDGGVWVLDVGAREWVHIETGPAVAVSAAGEDMPVLVLGADGTLRSYDPSSGERLAETGLMEPPGDGAPAPGIRIDTARAYVNDPQADAVHEIDYNDDLRLARTFDLGFSPDLMVETGW
ncbi:hypothetical protein [Marinactinospora rubrisoli]|uniref:ABC transporter n=1 Tax=Marinactinospora rubrisoli TaxID=2715399 RepID=A0ABW2KIE4_9ACTN